LHRCNLVSGYNPHVELLGVSTVAGNQTVDKTTENAAQILAAAGLGHIGALADCIMVE
jgi:purine nucleosidase